MFEQLRHQIKTPQTPLRDCLRDRRTLGRMALLFFCISAGGGLLFFVSQVYAGVYLKTVVKMDPVIAARIGDIDGTGQADFRAGKSFARVTFSGETVVGIQLVGDPEDVRGLAPAVLKKFSRGEIGDLLRGRLDLGLAPLLAARSATWA